MTSHSLLMLALLLALLTPLSALARQDQISVNVNAPKSAYTGDRFELQVIIRGSRNVPQPSVPVTPDYTIEYLGPVDASNFSAIFINGQLVQRSDITFAHKFAITARHPGPITIPSFEVVVDDRPFPTKPVTVTIQEPTQDGDFTFEITPEKTRFYEGEPIRIRFVWRFGKQPRNFTFQLPPLPPGLELLPGPDPRPPGTHPQDPTYQQFMIAGEPTIVAIAPDDSRGAGGGGGGQRYGTVTFDRILIAHAPIPLGPVHMAAGRIDFDAVIGERPRRFTDGPFPDLAILERHACVSKPFDLEVLPLPETGRPADFSGLVGRYTVTASADPRDASVGEPITLRVTVNGPPPLSLIPVLDLTQQPALASAFRVPRDPSLPTFTPVGAMFTYPIRARSPQTTQIPPIKLNYFDTAEGAYKTARSEPIHITIRPSATAGADIDEPDALADSREVAAKPSSRVDTAKLGLSGPDFTLAITHPASIAAIAVPPVIYAAAWISLAIRRRTQAHPAERRRRRAVKLAHRRLRRAGSLTDSTDSAATVAHALTDLAADWFDRPAGSLTSAQALHLLADQADDHTGQLAGMLAECDRIRFSGADTAGPNSLLLRTREVLERTAASLRSRPCS